MANIFKNIDLFHDESYDSWREKYWIDKNKHRDAVQEISEEINTASKNPIGKDKNPFIDDEIDFFKGTVETELKKRDYAEDSKVFFDAQLDLTKDVLPAQTFAEQDKINKADKVTLFEQQEHRPAEFLNPKELDKMKLTTQEAFTEIYPYGNNVPQSPNMKPISDIHHQDVDFASVTYKDQDKLSRIKERANKKYGEKNSYVKNLWVLKTYRDEGGNLDYKGEKPKSKDIKKQISGDDHKGGYPYEGGVVDSLQLEVKGENKVTPVGDNYLPKDSFDSGFTPPNKQISSGWDAQPFDDGGFQDSFQSEQKKPLNNLGDLLQKHLIEKSLTSDR
jgi:hypothetical protein